MPTLTMRATRQFLRRPIGLAWLIWLALLLPIAQTAAAWHAGSHAAVEAGGGAADKQAPHALDCDLCLAAAAIDAGALVAAPPTLPALTAGQASPEAGIARGRPAAPTLAYQSRAPPAVPR
ncbi:MAG: hypothetical protein JNL87_02055 [Burkholderiaceae bacterium]|nr:hypothetical protein [Burkholderiaceae bacterium]